MPLTFYSMSMDAVVVYDLIEDPTLSSLMKLTTGGVLFVKGQFIEETRSYYYEDPVPPPVSSMSFDTFDYYTPGVSIVGLNSGSNEWNNTASAAAWKARIPWFGIKEYDNFDTYAVSSSLSASLAGAGVGDWSGSTNWVGRMAFWGLKYFDTMGSYTAGTQISGSTGGVTQDTVTVWADQWDARSIWYGIIALDKMTGYTAGDSSFTGSNSQPDPRYTGFTAAWSGRSQ